MSNVVPQLTEDFFPGLGDQHVVGTSGLGVSIVTATLTCNTLMTDAQLIAGSPNTDGVSKAFGPVVHSLRSAPTLVIAQLAGVNPPLAAGCIGLQVMTANNSAVFVRAVSYSSTPLGVAVRIIAVR